MGKHTAEEAVEYLNDAADYAASYPGSGIGELAFDFEPDSDPDWCLLKWGRDSKARVHIDTLYGYAQDLPDHASMEGFARVIVRAKEGL